jgi:hypothetical protein
MSFTEAADAGAGETVTASATPEERHNSEEVRPRGVGRAAIDVFRGLGSRFLGFFGALVWLFESEHSAPSQHPV